jgi:hypothetical protein
MPVPRIRLSEDEYNAVLEHRTKHQALIDECEISGIPVDSVKYYWYKSEKFSMNVGNNTNIRDVLNSILVDIKQHSPSYPKIKYAKTNKESHLLVIDPADIHINKLSSSFETGDEYNHKIAFKRVIDGVSGLLSKSNGFGIEKILLVIGNDILHVDTPRNTTTSGTGQDVSLMWFDAFKMAQKLLTEVIETLVQVAPVHVQYDPSNHDYTNGFFLAQTLEAWFNKSKDITFDISPSHRKYFKYGANLIGTTHGDGAKEQDLPLLMAHESKDWGLCKHKYIYTHHIHHKKSKDYMGVTVESLRSPSGTDSWHHRNGYQHAPKAVEGFLHHPEHGQIARFVHYFS